MRYFLIQVFRRKNDDRFMMLEPEGDYFVLAALGLQSLQDSLKAILPAGYRVRKGATLAKRCKYGGCEFQSIMRTKIGEFKEVSIKPEITKTAEFYSKSRDATYTIHATKNENWELLKSKGYE